MSQLLPCVEMKHNTGAKCMYIYFSRKLYLGTNCKIAMYMYCIYLSRKLYLHRSVGWPMAHSQYMNIEINIPRNLMPRYLRGRDNECMNNT